MLFRSLGSLLLGLCGLALALGSRLGSLLLGLCGPALAGLAFGSHLGSLLLGLCGLALALGSRLGSLLLGLCGPALPLVPALVPFFWWSVPFVHPQVKQITAVWGSLARIIEIHGANNQ